MHAYLNCRIGICVKITFVWEGNSYSWVEEAVAAFVALIAVAAFVALIAVAVMLISMKNRKKKLVHIRFSQHVMRKIDAMDLL